MSVTPSSKRCLCLSLWTLLVVALLYCKAQATTTDTWTGLGTDANWFDSGMSGNWSTTNTPPVPVSGDALDFGGTNQLSNNNDFPFSFTGATFTGETFSGITFDSTAGSFTLGGNSIVLSGNINDNSANPESINFSANGPTGPNYGLVFNGGTQSVNVVSGGALSMGSVTFGNNPYYVTDTTASTIQSTAVTTLNINSNGITTNDLVVQDNNSSANTINIPNGVTFTTSGGGTRDSAIVVVGTPPILTTNTGLATTNLVVSGQGTWNVTNTSSNFVVGVGSGNNNTVGFNATLNMSGLANFSYNGGSGGNFYVGFGTRSEATVDLANTSNTITANAMTIGDSGQTPGFSLGNTNNNAGNTTNFFFGANSNVFNVNSILVGAVKSAANLEFPTGNTTGTLTINGNGGPGTTANITISDDSSGSGSGTSQLLLAGHNVQINGGTVIIGDAGGTTGSSTGIATFDTGTFNANALELAVRTSSTAAVVGTFTMGGSTPNNTATGVLNVASTFDLADLTVAATATGTFTLNGGTVNVGTSAAPINIVDASTSGTHTTTLNLAGGTLNMNGGAIGSSGAPITNVNLLTGGGSATLENLGGTGITTSSNTSGGLVMNGAGVLTLGGVNSYTGGTTVSSGTLLVTGSITDTVGVVTVNKGGTLAGNGDGVSTGLIDGAVTVNGGTLSPSVTQGAISKLTVAGLTFSSGTLDIDLGASFTSDLVNDTGALSISGTGTALNVAGSPATGTPYDIINYTGTAPSSTFASITGPIGFNYALDFSHSGEVLLDVTQAANVFIWNGAADGTTWDMTHKNFVNNNQNVAYADPDEVLFNDSAPAADTTVTIPSTVSPSIVAVNSSSNNYTFTGSGSIAGTGSLSKGGTSTLTVLTNNTYSGGTTISGGTLQVGNGGATGSLGSGPIVDDASLVYSLSGTAAVASAISGTGTLTQSGPGTLILTAANAYGQTIISGGTLQIDNGGTTGTLGSGAITDNGTLAIDRSDAKYVVANNISGSGGVTSMGQNVLQLTGTNSFTGPVTIAPGSTLQATSNSSIGATTGTVGNVTVENGASFDIGGNTAANTLNYGTRVFHIQGTGATGSLGALENTATGVTQEDVFNYITLDGNATIGGARMDIGRNVTNGMLNLNGHTLTVSMSGTANTVFGILDQVTVTPGNIIVASPQTGQNAGLDMERGASVGSGVNVTYQQGANAEFFETDPGTITAPLTFEGGNFIGGGASVLATVNSPITLQGNVTLEPSSSGVPSTTVSQPLLLAGNITDNGGGFSVTQAGESATTATLSGNNSYTGGTIIDGGTLQLGSSTALPATGGVNLNGGTLDMNGFNATVDSLTGSSTIGNSSQTSASTLTYTGAGNANNPSTFSGTIQDTLGSGNQTVALTIASGELIVNGSGNYSGGTTINSGASLDVTGGGALPSSGNVANNGSLLIDSGVNVNNVSGSGSTTISSGNSLTANNFSQAAGLVNNGNMQINGTGTVGQISGSGNLTLNGGIVQLAAGSGASAVGSLTINGSATLDITNNSLAINYGSNSDPAATIRSELISGFNALGAKWTGTGIISSLAAANPNRFTVAYADGGNPRDVANTSTTIKVTPGEVAIMYTVAGDANLSGNVDLSDLVIIASDFGMSGADWTEGDVNYDGNVDLSDLVIVASNFGASLGSVSGSDFSGPFAAEWQLALAEAHSADVSVPEPACAALALLGIGLLARRQRRSA